MQPIADDPSVVAFIAETARVEHNVIHIGEPTPPPLIAPARGPPMWDDGLAHAVPDWDALAQPEDRVALRLVHSESAMACHRVAA